MQHIGIRCIFYSDIVFLILYNSAVLHREAVTNSVFRLVDRIPYATVGAGVYSLFRYDNVVLT
jgi:hypothetical protein